MSGEDWFCFILGGVAGFIVGMLFAGCVTGMAARRDAVVNGHAEYVVKDGDVVWQWKDRGCDDKAED